MNRLILLNICTLFSLIGFAQITRQGQLFTNIPIVDNKVVFIREVALKRGLSDDANYNIIRDWAKNNYGRDPFISSIRYDTKNREIIAKSKIELLLPANSNGVREKMIMRYRVNAFVFHNKCVMEITEISYLYENTKYNGSTLPKVIRAETFISDNAIKIHDELREMRINTRKSTLYFLNELAKDFEKQFGV